MQQVAARKIIVSPSPEIDLLETLTAQDEKLIVASSIFGGIKDARNFERAKRVIQIHISSGVVQMHRAIGNAKQAVPDWEVRFVLADKTNWLNSTQEPLYWLSLTDKGREVFSEDSGSFFDRLFRK